MPAQLTTRSQVNGYRFLVRRMEHALVRRDVRMLHDPMRSQGRSMLVGIALAALVLAGCGILALLRPQDKVGNAAIVVTKESGAVFVRVEGTFHPAFNLASARLVLGEAARPKVVGESELGKHPRGPWVGIPAGPSSLSVSDHAERGWAVCDEVRDNQVGTTVVVGSLKEGATRPTRAGESVLVEHGGRLFLLYDGVRAPVDRADRAAERAYGLAGAQARPVSGGLLNSFRLVGALAAPRIPGAGSPPAYDLPGSRVGEVVSVQQASGTAYYVVLRDGLAQVGEVVADLVRFADSQGQAGIRSVAPDVVSALPTAGGRLFADLPQDKPDLLGVGDAPVACLGWTSLPDGSQRSAELLAGHAVPAPGAPAVLANPGGGADAVYVPPGAGVFVHAAGLDPGGQGRGALYYVADTGTLYGVGSREEADMLGLPGRSVAAPWAILGLLPQGPRLERAAALVAYDGPAALGPLRVGG